MPRKPRIEYKGAIYHIMSRGNRGDSIFEDDGDNELFIDTLAEACTKTGWLVHAFCLMGNHYHLLLETPEANLVSGMKWLQGTYTQRFNSRHRQWGHLLQGRYKALVVNGEADYFLTVSNYVHLNPARARMIPGSGGAELADFRWSSFLLYLDPAKRPEWLSVDRTLGSLGLTDDRKGLVAFKGYMDQRVLEVSGSPDPMDMDAAWSSIRRGWYLGDASFRKELLDRLDGVICQQGRRDSFSGEQVREHDELEAERLLRWGVDRLGIKQEELEFLKKSAPVKQALCWLLRKRTIVTNRWLAERLWCGHPSAISTFVSRVAAVTQGELKELRETLKLED